MAKRARGSTRPGQRKPITRRPATSTASGCRVDGRRRPRPAGLTDAELARAAELEAQLVAEEQAAAERPPPIAGAARRRPARSAPPPVDRDRRRARVRLRRA